MSYTLRLYAFEDVSPQELQAAERRFKDALEATLGDASLVAPVYAAYLKIVANHGETPADETLSPSELEIFSQWQAAELAATAAALGPNRYMGEAQFVIDG
ncbi:MAG: hypothetical protein HHJ16_06310 [Polaromonas sp.]|uniref:hypothetical protein n=1 Tax=Polaromonas sp. TaxID=1869339 RepID=UPI0017AB9ED8|nr:hypothetical protein [Polaromonas sp.]NMM09868.1 hypothetical protein [Polaromonas sp.]